MSTSSRLVGAAAFLAACGGTETPRDIALSNGVVVMDGVGDVTTRLTGSCEIDGTFGTIMCDGLAVRLNVPGVFQGIGYEVVEPVATTCAGGVSPAPRIAVFSFGNLEIPGGTTVYLRGSHAIALVARGTITVEGAVRGLNGEAGGFKGSWFFDAHPPMLGPSAGADVSGETTGGGGGAGGLTAGGRGGTGAGGAGGAALAAQVEPLCGGSGGGMVADLFPDGSSVVYGMGAGSGGAAVLLAAAGALRLEGAGCLVNVDGNGSGGSERGGPGGGAGGTLLLESPSIVVEGCTVSAIGGAGGDSPVSAAGGAGGTGAADPEDGLDGAYGGGGGGSAGFIRVRTTDCAAGVTGFSPPPSCETL